MNMEEFKKCAQFGIVTRKDVLGDEVDSDAVIRRVDSGHLITVHRGVYRLYGAADTFESRAWALTKYAGKGSAISHFAAAHLHGIEGFKEPTSLDVLVPFDVQVHPSGGCKVRRTREKFQIFKIKNLIPVTSLARTLVDLSEHLTEQELEKALHACWRRKDTIARWTKTYLASLKRRPTKGRKTLLRLIERMGSRGLDSDLEANVLHMIEKAGLPKPDHQFIIRDRQQRYVMRGDLGYVDDAIVLHIDSRYHQSSKAMARDARQRSILTDLEWTQLFVTKSTIKDGLWLEHLKRARAKAAALRAAKLTSSARGARTP